MPKVIKIKKGLEIPLTGKVTGPESVDTQTRVFGIVPDDYPGYRWKCAVKEGDIVAAGDPLLFAKEDEDIKLTAPVAGKVREVKRGERRKIEYVSVEKSNSQESRKFDAKASRPADIISVLKNSGLYALLRQRPFDTVPFQVERPRDIFVTAFDTAPLAPEMLAASNADLEKGLEVLGKISEGKVYLSVAAGSNITSRYAEVYEFEGPHPAGNVGTQIANIRPVNKGEVVWTLDALTAIRIGRLFAGGNLDFSARVALTLSLIHI